MSSISSFTPSKRHSLHTYSSSGPKPLQLVTGQASSLTTPATPDHQHKPRTLRTQSSISYKRSSYDSLAQSRPPIEVGSSGGKPRPRSVAYPAAPLQLTLAEKHADLLRFIAQKESKCLELRSQLAIHETELLQLKRTWERIVSRNFEFPHSTPPLNASTPGPPAIYYTPGSSNAMLEGIKEGVQGVSRLIAAGLSSSNTDHPSTPPTNISYTLSASRSNAKPTSKPRPHSLYSPLSSSSPISHIRSSNLSTSSTCTTATSATRFSAASPSSVSTFFQELEPTGHDAEQKLKNGDEYTTESTNGSPDSLGSQELIVRDTGATPTVSPNPKFKFRLERRRERENQRGRKDREVEAEDAICVWDQLCTSEPPSISIQDRLGKDEQREGTLRTLTANSSAINIDAGSTRCHRRKSRETSAASLRSLHPAIDEESEARTRITKTSGSSGRVSLPVMSAPASSIPGLSLAESAAMLIGGDLSPSVLNAPLPPLSTSNSNSNSNYESQTQAPSSSWTKRWTLSKSQKRASLLLSDVSQTLVSAFSLAVGSGSGSGPGSVSGSSSCASSASSGASSSSSSLVSTPPAGAKQASMSLIDEDDDDGDGDDGAGEFFSAASAAAVMEPMKPVLVGGQARIGTDVQMTGEVEDDDGEWGW